MKLSARNQLKGKVAEVREGAVNGVVVLDIGGNNKISATISMEAIRELNLKVGADAYAIIKATSVLVGIPD
jgi:molybdopterin-binding protein